MLLMTTYTVGDSISPHTFLLVLQAYITTMWMDSVAACPHVRTLKAHDDHSRGGQCIVGSDLGLG